MAIGKTNTGGGGGAGLNFKVVGGTTQPTTASENTIWVNTDTVITEWVFSAIQPTSKSDGTPLSGGEVWFNVGASSTVAFNALKKNGLWVYPASCAQHVGGAWVNVVAKIYQNGAWKDWRKYLWNNGSQGISFSQSGTVCPFVEGATQITWSYPSYSDGNTLFYTTNQIDLTPYSTLKATCAITGGHGNTTIREIRMWVGQSISDHASIARPESDVISIDISSFGGKYYIGFDARYSAGYISSWWLE